MKKIISLFLLLSAFALTFACSPKLDPQNSNNKIRAFYCQGETNPESLGEFVETNPAFVAGNSLVWFDDAAGSQGALFNGTGEEPGLPSMASPSSSFYWVAQNDGSCTGDAIRVKVRVRKSPSVSLDLPSGTFCFGAQLDLTAGLDDTRNVADNYLIFQNGSFLGNVEATKGTPNSFFIVSPVPGVNSFEVIAINDGPAACSDTVEEVLSVPAYVSLDTIPNDTVTAGDFVNISFSSPDPETSLIIWADHSSFNNPDIGLPGSIGLGPLSFIAANSGTGPLTAKVRVIPYNGNCAGKLQDFFITVYPSAPRLAADQQALRIYPNPATTSLTVRGNVEAEKIEVLTMQGKILYEGPGTGAVDISGLAAGIYLVRIRSAETSSIHRLIKL